MLDPDLTQYTESPHPFRCDTCIHYCGDMQPCDVVASPVKEHGCCNFWTRDKNAFYNGPKINMISAAYVEGDALDHNCDACKFFLPDGMCDIVGHLVNPDLGTCTVWEEKIK